MAPDLDTFMQNTTPDVRTRLRGIFSRGIFSGDPGALCNHTPDEIKNKAWKNMLKLRNCNSSYGNAISLANDFISYNSACWAYAYNRGAGRLAYGLSVGEMNSLGPMTALIYKNNNDL